MIQMLKCASRPLTRFLNASWPSCGKHIRVFLGEDDQIMKALYALQPKKERKPRRQKRHKLNVPVTFRLFNPQKSLYSEESYTGVSIDVSETGMMIRLTKTCGAAPACRCSCCFRRIILRPSEASATSKRAREIQGGAMRWIVGLQMMDVTPHFRAQLKAICLRASMWNLRDARK